MSGCYLLLVLKLLFGNCSENLLMVVVIVVVVGFDLLIVVLFDEVGCFVCFVELVGYLDGGLVLVVVGGIWSVVDVVVVWKVGVCGV